MNPPDPGLGHSLADAVFPAFMLWDRECPALAMLAADLAEYKAAEMPRCPYSRPDQVAAMRVLLGGFAEVGPSGAVEFHRSHTEHRGEARRYPEGLRGPFLWMRDRGLLECVRDDAAKQGKAAARPGAYRLSDELWQELLDLGFDPAAHGRPSASALVYVTATRTQRVVRQGREVVIKTRRRLWDAKHPDLTMWADSLADYAEAMAEHRYVLDGEALPPAAFALRRIFSNDFDHLGRCYCAFVNAPRDVKPRLLIDGQATVACDYSALHFRLSHAVAGLGDFEGDPFRLPGVSRADAKDVCNALVNAKAADAKSLNATALQALQDEARRTGAPWPKSVAVAAKVRKALTARHPEVAKLFGAGLGLKLQRADSEIVMAVIDVFARARRPVVCEHDGFRLLAKDRPLLEAALPEGEARMFGRLGLEVVRLPVKWS